MSEKTLSWIYRFASREHLVIALLWRTGMRRSALQSLDVDDLGPIEYAPVLVHRPEQGTKPKNGEDGERWVDLAPAGSRSSRTTSRDLQGKVAKQRRPGR